MADEKKETGAGHSLPWFRVNTDVTDHPKLEALADALDDPNAGWYVIRLWSWVMRYAARGRLADGAETALERACRWRGPPGELVEALITTGLLTRDGKALEVNDWSEYQGAAVKKAEKDAERKRLARGRRGDGAGTARVQDETRRDETRRDATEKPSPASRAPRLTPEVLALMDAWNHNTTPPLPRWEKGREKAAAAALKRRPLVEWVEVFRRVEASGFLRGEDGGWKADVDFVLRPEGRKPETAQKVLEGSYDRTPAGAGKPRDIRHPQQPGVFAVTRDAMGDF